jgi:hypothetical protein
VAFFSLRGDFVVKAKRNKSLWLCHRLITNQPSSVGWNPRLRLAEDGLAGGRLREAQKSLKKKNCLSTESWSFAFWL